MCVSVSVCVCAGSVCSLCVRVGLIQCCIDLLLWCSRLRVVRRWRLKNTLSDTHSLSSCLSHPLFTSPSLSLCFHLLPLSPPLPLCVRFLLLHNMVPPMLAALETFLAPLSGSALSLSPPLSSTSLSPSLHHSLSIILSLSFSLSFSLSSIPLSVS